MAFKSILIVASLIAIVNGYGYAYAGGFNNWNPPPMFGNIFSNFPGFPNFPMPQFPTMPPMPPMPPIPVIPPLNPDSIKDLKGEGVGGIYVSSYSVQRDQDGKPIRKKGGVVVINNDGEVFEKNFGDADQPGTTSGGSK